MDKGWHLAPLTEDIDFEVDFRRDPDGLCQAVGKALNDRLLMDPHMNGWQWSLSWSHLPGAIAIEVAGTALNREAWNCPTFFAATSIATYEEVDQAAERLQERIQRALDGWKR